MAELLRLLSETNAVSGNEKNIRDIILREISPVADDIRIDSMGNIIAVKKGAQGGKKIAVTANMDEPGFIISSVTDKGYLKFKAVGKIDPRKIISKKVVIGDNKVKGVIGMKAIHLQTKSERENVVSVSKLFIDIGAKNKTEAEKRINLGDYVTFDTKFETAGNNVRGKALDRSGPCLALMSAMKREYPYDLYACFLTQHEVGARGAQIVSHAIQPDVSLTVSAADTEDMYGCEKNGFGVCLGGGTVINYADKTAAADKKTADAVIKAARKADIKVQTGVLKYESGDWGAMQRGGNGAMCFSAVIPCRYSHSPVSLMSSEDIRNTSEYISLFLNKIVELI